MQALARARSCVPCASALLATQKWVAVALFQICPLLASVRMESWRSDPTLTSVTVPQLLGRADTMSDFVLQGEAEGWIEITLSRDDNGRPITFRRQIRTRDNHSDWKIDGMGLCTRSLLRYWLQEPSLSIRDSRHTPVAESFPIGGTSLLPDSSVCDRACCQKG